MYLSDNTFMPCAHNGYCLHIDTLFRAKTYISYDRYIWFLSLRMGKVKYVVASSKLPHSFIECARKENAYFTEADQAVRN
ncbi:hypothetical protein VNO78_24504 [Psophocarpus tetragonolobus]|uniref:Uncharacterized protein n=1 Tax=Psophocarpus tetragonolobus TaxID=3891 RepID=A0AAN9S4H8_PSOTE